MGAVVTHRSRILLLAGALALGGLAVFVPGRAIVMHRNVSFDGGFNAQVARNLAEQHRYATSYRGLHDFDHRVQTGPTLIVPTAVAFRLLGINNATAQLANLVYLAGVFLLTALLCWKLSGPLAAYIVTPVLLATPHLFQLGMGLYGELPALFFLLAALLFLYHWMSKPVVWAAGAAGLSLGLAVLTKFQMLLPTAAVAGVVLMAAGRCPGFRRSHYAVATGGFIAVLLPWELVKLHTLSAPVYLQWWRAMLGRSIAQATSFRMPHTLSGPEKPWVHLGILAHQMHLPVVLVMCLLFLPPILLAILLCRLEPDGDGPRPTPRDVVLLAMAAAGLSITLWWLFLSPTSHTWLRRVVDGLLLLEILGTVVVVESTRHLCRRSPAWAGKQSPSFRHFHWIVPVALVLLGQALSVLAWNQIPGLTRAVGPSPERSATRAMVTAINALPRDAEIYAKGWYEAPVLAALTGRVFLDLDQFPIDRYRRPLDNVYFIADAAMARNQPEEIEDVLRRAAAVVVNRAGANSLFYLTGLCPYAPIVHPEDPGELLSMFHPRTDFYPYRGGIGSNSRYPDSSHVVCGVLLARRKLPCLLVDLNFAERAGRHPRVVIHLDGREVSRETVDGGKRYLRSIPLPPVSHTDPVASLVEISIHRDGGPPTFYLWDPDWGIFSLNAVGFVPTCAGEAGKTVEP